MELGAILNGVSLAFIGQILGVNDIRFVYQVVCGFTFDTRIVVGVMSLAVDLCLGQTLPFIGPVEFTFTGSAIVLKLVVDQTVAH